MKISAFKRPHGHHGHHHRHNTTYKPPFMRNHRRVRILLIFFTNCKFFSETDFHPAFHSLLWNYINCWHIFYEDNQWITCLSYKIPPQSQILRCKCNKNSVCCPNPMKMPFNDILCVYVFGKWEEKTRENPLIRSYREGVSCVCVCIGVSSKNVRAMNPNATSCQPYDWNGVDRCSACV